MRIHKQLSLQRFSDPSVCIQGKQHWWIAVCQTVGRLQAAALIDCLKMQFAVLSLQADSFEGIVRMRLDPTRKGNCDCIFTCTLRSTLTVTGLLTYSSSMQAFHPRSRPFSACMSSSVRLNWKICVINIPSTVN